MSFNDVQNAPGNTGNPIKGPTEGSDTQALGGGKVVDAPSVGDGTGSSGERRAEELKANVPGLEEKERIEQGK